MSDQTPTPTPPPEPKRPVDVRAGEIRTGAGLEESRYNVEFIEALRKYSTPVLLIVAAIVAGYWGFGRWKAARDTARASAFTELEAQLRTTGQGGQVSPDVLLRIAEDAAGQGAAPLIARLTAADQWVLSASLGLAPGAERDPATNAVKNKDDILTPEQRTQLLTKAKEQYQLVLDQTQGIRRQAIFSLRAIFGLAAVAESNAQWDQAKALYEQSGQLAASTGFPAIEAFAKSRGASVDELKTLPVLVPESAVQSFAPPPPVVVPPMPTEPSLATPSIQLSPPTVPSAPIPAPAPAEAPKP